MLSLSSSGHDPLPISHDDLWRWRQADHRRRSLRASAVIAANTVPASIGPPMRSRASLANSTSITPPGSIGGANLTAAKLGPASRTANSGCDECKHADGRNDHENAGYARRLPPERIFDLQPGTRGPAQSPHHTLRQRYNPSVEPCASTWKAAARP
jgi:hypothetical protein